MNRIKEYNGAAGWCLLLNVAMIINGTKKVVSNSKIIDMPSIERVKDRFKDVSQTLFTVMISPGSKSFQIMQTNTKSTNETNNEIYEASLAFLTKASRRDAINGIIRMNNSMDKLF